MTLRQLVSLTCPTVTIPNIIAVLGIEVDAGITPSPSQLKPYFVSKDFQVDLNDCVLDYEDAIYNDYECMLRLYSSERIHLKIDIL